MLSSGHIAMETMSIVKCFSVLQDSACMDIINTCMRHRYCRWLKMHTGKCSFDQLHSLVIKTDGTTTNAHQNTVADMVKGIVEQLSRVVHK